MRKIFIPLVLSTAAAMTSGLAFADTISCTLENNRILKISNLSTSPKYAYGPAGKVELELPTGAANSTVYKGEEMFSGGGANFIAFTNGNYTYVAYDGIGRGWEFTGIKVYKGSDTIMERQCKPGSAFSIDISSINAPEGELPY